MARDGLFAFLCAGAALGALPCLCAAPPEDRGAKLRTQLAVQAALQKGRDHLQRGDYQAAVYVLEAEVARIDGNRAYLSALRDAYRGYVRELRQANRTADLATYIRRLEILDPGWHLEQAATRPRTASAPPAPAPEVKPPAPAVRAPAPPPVPVARSAMPEDQETASPPRAPARAATPTARGKVDDPFAEANSRKAHEARALRERANQEFQKGHYEAAGLLYEQAHQVDPASDAGGGREQWAYCKLFTVAQGLNRLAANASPPPELEREVRKALALSPKLESVGKDLLRKVRNRRAGGGEEVRVEVRHRPAQGQGWSVAETANFRVLHQQSRELAERVARTAEATRAAMLRKWFGDASPTWTPCCDIYLHATGQDYARATQAPPQSPGHSTMNIDNGRVLGRRIDLHCDNPHMCDAVLPHETTHVVLAGRFGTHHVPRWADEGMAVLTEPQDRIDLHLRNLPRHRSDRHLFGVGQLMRMDNYPDPRYVGPFYAQSVSLVDFLSRERGPRVFVQFLREGLDTGYEAALVRHYGIRNFDELEQRWYRFAFDDRPRGTPVAEKAP